MPAAVNQFAAAIGAGQVEATPINIDPVTGDVTLNQNQIAVGFALFDVWLPFDVTVVANAVSGSCSAMIALYERRRIA